MKGRIYGFYLLGVGAVLIGIGIWRAEPMTILRKAVAICLECIGIG